MPEKDIDLSFLKNVMENDMTRDMGHGTWGQGQQIKINI